MGIKLSDKNRLSITHPELCKEWDHEKNCSLKPGDVSFGCNVYVWWVCSKCSKSWYAAVHNRTYGKGCPECAKIQRGKSRSYSSALARPFIDMDTSIVKEWHYEKNVGKCPEDVSCGSSYKAYWKCDICGSVWKTSVKHRSLGTGCPECAKHKIAKKLRVPKPSKSLASAFPLLAEEWDKDKNVNHSPAAVSYGSNTKVWWVCKICGCSWLATVSNRTGGRGCPGCSGYKITDVNNLAAARPDLLKDWSYTRNKTASPENIVPGNSSKVWWDCHKCGHVWRTTVYNRALNGRGCPCCANGPVSRISQEWLDSICLPKKNREVLLPELGIRVDAFDPETNTAYEFLGDYWHGNPAVYCQDDYNQHNGKTFGQLFDKTMERLFLLRRCGYNLNIIWEEDFTPQ